MAISESVLAYLATRLSSHPENIATDALAYVLRVAPASKALLEVVNGCGLSLPASLAYSTQDFGDNGGIPDLVGRDGEDDEVLIVEAKFWAGLTDNQPRAYLDRLPKGKDAILLFIAPARRIAALRDELVALCKDRRPVLSDDYASADLAHFRLNDHHLLAIVSWGMLLGRIIHELSAAGQSAVVSDAKQLLGLCKHMDEVAFLPLRREELASSYAVRHAQFCGLVNDLSQRLISNKIAASAGRTSGTYGNHSQSISIGSYGCTVQLNLDYWSKWRPTPIWISVREIVGGKWNLTARVRSALAPLLSTDPVGAFATDDGILVPLDLPLGADREAVLKSLYAQALEVAKRLT